MDDLGLNTLTQRGREGGRKTYARPLLTTYGSVKLLTQTGSTKSTENSGADLNMLKPSDRALKEGIMRIGNHPMGFGLYLFHYKLGHRGSHVDGRCFGVMADEVECVIPAAVSMHEDGFKRVNYTMLGIRPADRSVR